MYTRTPNKDIDQKTKVTCAADSAAMLAGRMIEDWTLPKMSWKTGNDLSGKCIDPKAFWEFVVTSNMATKPAVWIVPFFLGLLYAGKKSCNV